MKYPSSGSADLASALFSKERGSGRNCSSQRSSGPIGRLADWRRGTCHRCQRWRAAGWYERFGAACLLDDPLKLILPLTVIADAVTAAEKKRGEERRRPTQTPHLGSA